MKATQRKLKSNIWKLYLYYFFSGIFFSVPIMVLFWQENGLSLTQIMILQSIFSIMMVSFEIPTGYFADVYGRKKTLMLAGIFLFVAISAYSIGYGFSDFLIAELFFALAFSFMSGTSSAFLYDTLLNLKQEKHYKKIWGNVLFYRMIGLAISSIIAGFIAKIDLRYTLYASIPFFALLIPIAISMYEPKRYKAIIKKGYAKKLLRTIASSILKNKKLKWIIIYSGIIFAFNQSSLWLYQPYFKLSGLDIAYFGFVFAGFQIISAISAKYAHKIEKKLGQKYSLSILIFLIAGSYLLMSNFVFLFSFSFCFISQFVRGFKGIIISDYINKLTDSSIRATVLSAESFIGRLLYATIAPFVGWVADIYTLTQAFAILGITTFISGIIITVFLRKNKVI